VVGMLYIFQPNRTSLCVGLMDGEEAAKLTPQSHIFLKDKSEWFTVPEDGVERYQEFPGGFEKKIEEYHRHKGQRPLTALL
jgi:hypothetical protein